MRRFWTEERDAVLRRDYPTKHLGSLAVRIGTTVAGLKSRAKILGLHREVNAHHPWSAGQLEHLKGHYADTPIDVLVKETGHCRDSIYNKAQALGLRRTEEFKREFGLMVSAGAKGRAHRFEKGHVPFNKGKREHEFRSPEGIARCARTRFKKGNRPHNIRKVGYECFRRVGDTDYVYIKVAEGEKMVMKHRWLWEQAHGPIPEGCCVVFRDGDTHNCTLENLELVTRGEHARRQIERETPEARERRTGKAADTRRHLIRLDRARIHFGLEPRTKLVKRW